MTDSELLERAAQAGYNYHKVYGSFPDRIGIPLQRWRLGCRNCIMFPEPPPVTARLFLADSMDTFIKTFIHRTLLEPVDGPGVNVDEVYVEVPELPDGQERIRSGEAMARMARSECEVKCE